MKKLLSLLLCLLLLAALAPAAFAAPSAVELDNMIRATGAYLLETVTEPGVAAVGGDWVVFALARSGCEVPAEYYSEYLSRVEVYTAEHNGVLSSRKLTEHARVAMALAALGKDPTDVAGYDLTTALGDLDKVSMQGLNGPIWALLALDAAELPFPSVTDGGRQGDREQYLSLILEARLPEGGWTIAGDEPNVDVTAMVMQVLSRYRERAEVASAIEAGLSWLSSQQLEDGSFSAYEQANLESTAQVLIALCTLGLGPEDARFVKNGNTTLDATLAFRMENGAFRHTAQTVENMIATQQGLMALAAVKRARNDMPPLYDLSDADAASASVVEESYTPAPLSVTAPGKTFADVAGHPDQAAVEALAQRGVINGMTDTSFEPDATMTRAQFAAITVRALGLEPQANTVFEDVAASSWYAAYVGAANRWGIVKGVYATRFSPAATITRQEAAVMVARAARLCGLSGVGSAEALRPYADAAEVSDWAVDALAFCVEQEIFKPDGALCPKDAILRCEIARMLYRMLDAAGLIA